MPLTLKELITKSIRLKNEKKINNIMNKEKKY